MDYGDLLEECAHAIKEEILPFFGRIRATADPSERNRIVEEIFSIAEKALVKILQDHKISCTLINEGTGVKKVGLKAPKFFLVANPLDTASNLARGLPCIATSLAISQKPDLANVESALVSDLFQDVTYMAQRNHNAYRNGKTIKPSSFFSLEKTIFSLHPSMFQRARFLGPARALLGKTNHARYFGADSLEICYVADGTIDAFIDLVGAVPVTSIAAAYLVITEAGGYVMSPKGRKLNVPLDRPEHVAFIAVANTSLYNEIRECLEGE